MHILLALHRCFQDKSVYINAAKSFTIGEDANFKEYVGYCEVGNSGAYFSWMINKIIFNGEACSMFLYFL